MTSTEMLRDQLASFQEWHDAHADFDAAVSDFPSDLRGIVPPGLPYSAWQVLEHIRLAQEDILEFCRNPHYKERNWPADYWPSDAEPPNATAWDASAAAYRRDRKALQAMIRDSKCDLFAKVPIGSGQTFLREFLLVADHTAYHVGQLVAMRRLVGAWAEGQQA
jgi:uncharacterized damage-inducible protein DinB